MRLEKQKRRLFPCLTMCCVVTVLAAFALGSVNIPLADIGQVLWGKGESTTEIILLGLRLPRVAAAGIGGMGLAAAGLLLQTVTGNGLCAPNIVGINSGAGLAVVLMMCLFPGKWYLLPVAAFLGAFIAANLVVLVTYACTGGMSKTTLILAGVAVSSLMSAGISYLILRYPDTAISYSSFSVGGFAGVHFRELWLPAGLITASLLCAFILADRIQLFLLGDEIAASLGMNVQKMRFLMIVLASVLSASVVSYAGLLGFIGLAVPHISRMLCGQNIRRNLIASSMLGFILAILADLVGRTAFAPSELPAGIITAAVGAPFFLYLLLRKGKRL